MKEQKKKKMKFKEVLFVLFHKKAMLKSLELVLKYSGVNLDLATRKKVEKALLHPIKEGINQKRRKKEQR